jgi:hypothetical protein
LQRRHNRARIMGRDTQERERRPFWHRLPCYQLRSVATLTPIIRANSLCDFPSFTRTAFTSAGRNVNVGDGFRAPSGRSLVLCVHEHLASKHKRSSR